MSTENLMKKYPILSAAWDECSTVWKGLAIPCEKSTADGGIVQSEKVLKFSRKHLRTKRTKADPRLVGGQDNMIEKVGKPGSRERVLALAEQYARMSEVEQSPFAGE